MIHHEVSAGRHIIARHVRVALWGKVKHFPVINSPKQSRAACLRVGGSYGYGSRLAVTFAFLPQSYRSRGNGFLNRPSAGSAPRTARTTQKLKSRPYFVTTC